jgi:hypothetical protein
MSGHISFDTASISTAFNRQTRDMDELLSPDEMVGIGFFRCDFSCTNDTCGSTGFVIGHHTQSVTITGYKDTDTIHTYEPRAFWASPFVLRPPAHVPDRILGCLRLAHAEFWMDAAACTWRCRTVVELLMDSSRVPKTRRTASHSQRRIPLHDRLLLYRQRHNDVAELLLAAKWIGNDGVHSAVASRTEAISALSLIHHALDLLYDKAPRRIRQLARAVNRKHEQATRRRSSKKRP